MNNDFEKYLREFLLKNNINPKDLDFSKVHNCKSLLGQLEECGNNLSTLRLHLEIIFNLYKKGIYIYRDDYKGSIKYSQEKDVWISIDDSTIMSTENYIEYFLIDKNRLLDLYEQESIYVMGNPFEMDDEECKLAEALIAKSAIQTDYEEEIDEAVETEQISQKIKTADSNFIAQLCRKSHPASYKRKGTGGLVTRLYRDMHFNIADFLLKEEYKAEICKIIYFFTVLEHTTIIRDLQEKGQASGKRGTNKQYFNSTDFLSRPSMENTGAKFLCDKKSKRFNGKVTDFIKNELEKEINLRGKSFSETEHIRAEFKNIVIAWTKLFNNVQNAIGTNQEVDFGQMICICNSISPQFPPYKELQRQYGFRNQVSEPDIQTNESPCSTSPIVVLYFKILQFEYLGEIEDRRTLNKLKADSNYDVPQNLIERMIAYKDHFIEYRDVEKYIRKNIGLIAEYVYLKSNVTEAEKKRLRDHINDVLIVLDFCTYAGKIKDSKSKISKLFIISCYQAIILDEDGFEDEYIFYDYQHHLKSSHSPKISCRPISAKKSNLAVQKIHWAQRAEAHWYANIGKHELYCKSRTFKEYLYRILIHLCAADNIEEMKRYSEECYEKLEPFFKETSAEG